MNYDNERKKESLKKSKTEIFNYNSNFNINLLAKIKWAFFFTLLKFIPIFIIIIS
jgi:hypothetical protein